MKLRILLVDDATFIRDLILSDWEMPGLSGEEPLIWVRAEALLSPESANQSAVTVPGSQSGGLIRAAALQPGL